MEVGVVRRHGTTRMWAMLLASVLLLVPLGVLSNVTHSLLLTLEVYHMLYNALTLVGWLLTVRMDAVADLPTHTFGWARLEVLTTVMSLLFLLALCFSVFVEAVQSLANAAHADDMHHPVYVMACAAAVLLANLVCYILIGGFTSLQSILLAPSETAKLLSPAASEAQLRPDSRLAHRTPAAPLVRHFVRDLGGAMLLVVSAVTAYLCRAPAVRYLDPALALLAASLLVVTSRGIFSECCLILLQTMPATFDAAVFRSRLLAAFPAVQDVHELHVWQLTPDCVVATAHVVLAGPQQFNDVAERVTAFFAAHAVGRVTLQPEFSGAACSGGKSRCLLPCSVDSCAKSRCCDEPVLRRVPTIRVTPPSQASLVSRGSRGSGGGKTTNSARQTKDQDRVAEVNGDCVKHAPESDGVPESDKAATVDGADAGDDGERGDGTGKDSTGNVRKAPLPAPRSCATEAPLPTENATKESIPSEGVTKKPVLSENATREPISSEDVTKEPMPSEDAKKEPIPSEVVTKKPVPLERTTKPLMPSESVTETPSSSESVAKTLLPHGSVTVTYGSVSSVGDWHDAEG